MTRTVAKKSWAMIIAAGCMWGSMGFFNRFITVYGLSQLQIVYLRMLVATVGLGLVLMGTSKGLFKVKIKDLWCFIGSGMISMLCLNITYFFAMQYTTLSVAALLLSTSPAYVMLFSAVLFGEKLNKRKVTALIVMLAGCVFITGAAEGELVLSWQGLLFGLASGICYALYSIFGRFALNKGYQSETIAFYTFLFAFIGIAPFGEVGLIAQAADLKLIVLALAMGVVTCIFPYVLYTKGLSGVENSLAAILATSEPITATLIGGIVFKEELSLGNFLGIVLIISSVLIMNRNKRIRYKEYI